MAASITSLKLFLLRCRAKSEVAIIPTNTFFFVTGSCVILFLTIVLAASLSEESSSIVISGFDITSETLVSSFNCETS